MLLGWETFVVGDEFCLRHQWIVLAKGPANSGAYYTNGGIAVDITNSEERYTPLLQKTVNIGFRCLVAH